jgi:formiminoglutamase
LRDPGRYLPPRYDDPMDPRMVRIIRPASRRMPRAVNLLGVPFDGAVLGRKGAAGGPEAVRLAMSGFSNYNPELKLGLESSRVFDLGDLAIANEEVDAAHLEVEEEVGRDLDASSLLVVVGGDNSISLPSMRAYARKFGKVGLVAIDSHFDLRGRIGGKPTSGSSYGLALEELEGLASRRVAEIGIHGFLNSSRYASKARALGIEVFTAEEVRKRGATRVAKDAWATASRGANAVYLSVDLDAVGLAEVSGVSAPSAGGIDSTQLFDLLYHFCGQPKVKCADLVELAPSLDPTGRSQIVAASSLVYMIAGFRSRSAKGRGP